MEFGILGPLEVRDRNGRDVSVQGRRRRALLAILLVHANEPVAPERLIDELWDGNRPLSAQNALQVHVSHLRKALSEGVLVTEAGGYRLSVEPDEIDATRFEQLVTAARRELAAGRHEPASAQLLAALELWRGPALAEFREARFAEAEIARLEELRAAAAEERVDAELALGHHARIVPELESLVAASPLRERLRSQLMLALYRCGRQAEALEEYGRARRELVGGLGIEPSAALKSLQAAILRQDQALERGSRNGSVWTTARSERRTVTALCAAFAAEEERDPEATARASESQVVEVERIVKGHGGRVLEESSDRVLAVFGLPPASEDDALRALRAAVELRAALPVGVGVDTGPVLFQASSSQKPDLVGSVLGEVPRLAFAAKPGEVVIGESTRALAGHALRLRRLGRRPTWKLVELRPDATAIPRHRAIPLVGRDEELGRLLAAFESAVSGRTSQLVTVLGPAGIGKSRLAAEFRRRVAAVASVFSGRCLPYGDGITFWPLAENVEQAAGERAPGALAERLGEEDQAGTIAERVSGALGAGGDISGTEETFWAVRRFLEGLARSRPVVVLVEDLHWAAPTFLDLIEHLASFSGSAPILVVCLARPELLDVRPNWPAGAGNAASVVLEPLSDRQSSELVEQLVDESRLGEPTRTRIVDAAGGNPLFLEELARVAATTGAEEQAPLPPTIQAVLATRLDQLGPQERATAEAASIVGHDFWLDAVTELVGGDDVAGHLQELVRKDLVKPRASALTGADSFRFRHLLIRDATYEAIPKRRRADLHRQFGDWLERTARERLTEFQEIVGFHLEQAFRYRSELGGLDSEALALSARAANHLAAAAARAHAREDTPAEIALLSRAVELLPADASRRLELLPELGSALGDAGEFQRAESFLGEAEALAAETGDTAVAAYTHVIQLLLRFRTDAALDVDDALAQAQRSIRVLEQRGVDRWLAKGWELLAWIPYLGCRSPEAEAALHRMADYARQAGDRRLEARALALLFGTAVFGPLPVREGIERCEQALRRHAESQAITASATRALANLVAMDGDFDRARSLVARDKAISDELGRPFSDAKASIAYGMLELLADDAAAAEVELRAGFEALARFGEKSSLGIVAAWLAEALYRQERDGESLALIDQARRVAAEEDLTLQATWRGLLAKIRAREGRSQEAGELVEAALVFARRTDSLTLRGDVLMDASEVYRLNGEPLETVAAHVRKAINAYDRKGNRVAAKKARRVLSALADPSLA